MDITTTQQSIEQVVRLSETMEKTGVAITVIAVFLLIVLVCAIVFLTSFVRKENNREKQYGTLLKEIMEQNQTFTDHMLNRPQTQIENQSGLFKVSVECGAIVEEHLKYLFSKTKADRVAVYVFHNGQRMLNGNHLLKCSCLNEYALLDKHFLSIRHKDTPISQISVICNALLKNGYYHCEDTSKIDDSSLKAWVDTYGYKSIFVSAVFSTQGDIIGFVSADYIDTRIYPDKLKVTTDELKRLADKVTVAIDADIIK